MECFQEARDLTWNPSERTSPNFSEWGALSWRWWGQWVSKRCSTTLPDNMEIAWMDVCSKLIRVLSPNLVRGILGDWTVKIMSPIFSYLHNTDCLSNLLSHSDLSKSGKNTQDRRSWTRARITCQNTDQNFTSAGSSPCLKRCSFPNEIKLNPASCRQRYIRFHVTKAAIIRTLQTALFIVWSWNGSWQDSCK